MKIVSIIAGILLGLLFVASSVFVLFKLAPMPPVPEGTAESHFMAAFMPTGHDLREGTRVDRESAWRSRAAAGSDC